MEKPRPPNLKRLSILGITGILIIVFTLTTKAFVPFAFVKTITEAWNFGVAGNFTYSTTFFTVSSSPNTATLTPIDLTYNSQAEFDTGTYSGTAYSGGVLKLDSTTGSAFDLTSTWAPYYSDIESYWKLENNFNDSGVGNNLTASGGATFSTSSKVGSYAGSFDGVDDVASVADPADASLDFAVGTSFTYAVWVNVTSSAGTLDCPFSKGVAATGSYSPGYKFELGTGNWDARISSGSADAYCNFGTESQFLGHWTHLAVVVDRSAALLRCYVNGVQTASTSISGLGTTSNATMVRMGSANGASGYFKGLMDEMVIWKNKLSAEDLTLIYERQRQKYSGLYISPVAQLTNAFSSWNTVSWVTSLPFLKELPGDTDANNTANSETSTNYSAISSGGEDVSNGLTNLWHLDESSWNGTTGEVLDSVGTRPMTKAGGATNVTGLFGNAGSFDGVTGSFVNSTALNWSGSTAMSVSAWVKNVQAAPTSQGGIFLKKASVFSVYMASSGILRYCIANGTAWHCNGSGSTFTDWDQWHLVTVTYDNSYLRFYRDGKKTDEWAETGAFISSSNNMQIGQDSSTAAWNGYIDEVGLWNRKLTDSEVVQLYRRGANRVKFQFRTCTNNSCSDAPAWVGPDGTGSSWFSELHNMASVSSTGAGSGLVNLTSPVLDLTKWMTAVSGWAFGTNPAKYFQYRILMQSDDANSLCSSAACMPEVTSVKVVPSVVMETSLGRAIPTGIYKFNITMTGDCQTNADVRFQVSNDNGTTYKYWNGSAWTAVTIASSYNEAANYTNTNANIGTLGAGTFRFRALVPAEISKTCVLSGPYIQRK